MRIRFCALTLTTIACAALSACNAGDALAPTMSHPSASASLNRGLNIPGLMGAANAMTEGGLHGCEPRDPQFGAATIGSSGGELIVGPHRLIIPAGALTETVQISGTVIEGDTTRIELEPHGLQFKKPAGLVLDMSSCTDVPDIVYINELGVVSDPIVAIYSTWWHTVAAPIWHFSGYAVAF